MNRIYINSKITIDKYILRYIYGLIPLIIYGIYKNGILLYNLNLINFLEIFKILYLLIISLIIYTIYCLIFKKKIKLNLEVLNILIIPLFVPPSVNILIYTITLFIGLIINHYLSKVLKYNNTTFMLLFILLFLIIFKNYNYLNLAEATKSYSFSFLDLLFGRNTAGIASSSIIIGLLLIIYFSIFTIYKKEITLSSIISFILLIGLLNNFNIVNILNGNAILSLILIAPDMLSTPIKRNEKIIYGIIIGLLSALLTQYVDNYCGSIIAILLISIIYNPIRKIDNLK